MSGIARRHGNVIGVEYKGSSDTLGGNELPFVSSPLKRWSATVFCTFGLALSVHLALLKFFSLPCFGPGGCHSVIHSGYGTVLRLPVGLYGAILWGAAICVSDQTKRAALLCILAVGSAAFMGIQFFVLRGFCLYCTAHAVTAWIAFALHRSEPRRIALALGVLFALGGFVFARQQAAAHVAAALPPPNTAAPLSTGPSGLAWLGPLTPRSPALVVSLNCAACLDLFQELLRQNYKEVRSGPAIYFKVTDENRELTSTFVAAVLAQPGSKRDGFLAAVAMLLSVKDQALSAPTVAATQFNALFPSAMIQRKAAEQVLVAQTQELQAHKLGDTTPLLVPLGTRPRAFFKVEELF